jgi:hypothetical protein
MEKQKGGSNTSTGFSVQERALWRESSARELEFTEQKFSKGRSISDQKAHEEMLNVPGHKGNANQNHNSSKMSIFKYTTTNVSEDPGKKEPLYIVGGNVN